MPSLNGYCDFDDSTLCHFPSHWTVPAVWNMAQSNYSTSGVCHRAKITDRQPDVTAASALVLPNPLAKMLQATGGGLTRSPFNNILALSVDIRTVTYLFGWEDVSGNRWMQQRWVESWRVGNCIEGKKGHFPCRDLLYQSIILLHSVVLLSVKFSSCDLIMVLDVALWCYLIRLKKHFLL